MPGRQPFTALCQELGAKARARRVDLHIHTTFSDGSYTPEQVVELACRCGMPALAITDHDTVAGIAPARQAAGDSVQIIPGVEITAHHAGQTVHLLGYFFDPEDPRVGAALIGLQRSRAERFQEMVERLQRLGIAVAALDFDPAGDKPLGRRHLAERIVLAGSVRSVGEAFGRYLRDDGPAMVPFRGLPAADAIGLIRTAGGVTSWAHPPADASLDDVRRLEEIGLQALEVEFPACCPRRSRELRLWASHAGLAVTGGSDCHGPDDRRRPIGGGGIRVAELADLRNSIALEPL